MTTTAGVFRRAVERSSALHVYQAVRVLSALPSAPLINAVYTGCVSAEGLTVATSARGKRRPKEMRSSLRDASAFIPELCKRLQQEEPPYCTALYASPRAGREG
ncbi:hypothetical protein AAFF_G00278990 [Aldrovandia affinis]|uniref:Uncharacterized protein n=1 Tax=Aldrovandia affinis TaxID=143900 RepID=A0AAD7WSF6_9TELE|nr:hypothetical protein AAFF_G00278990 [Aldrovandia affinis]